MDAPLPKTASKRQSSGSLTTKTERGASDVKITTMGIDLVKEVFQIHSVDEHGKAALRKQLRRSKMANFC